MVAVAQCTANMMSCGKTVAVIHAVGCSPATSLLHLSAWAPCALLVDSWYTGYRTADRQTLMFSATWPTAVQQLAQNYLCAPVKVTIGSQDLAASHSVTQVVEVVEQQVRRSC